MVITHARKFVTRLMGGVAAIALLAAANPARGQDAESRDKTRPTIGQLVIQTIGEKHYIHSAFKTDLEHLDKPVGEALGTLIKSAKDEGVALFGPVLHLYKGSPHRNEVTEFRMETGFLVPPYTAPLGEFRVRVLPEFRCASVLYMGSAEHMDMGWKKLYDSIRAKGLRPTYEERELYLFWEAVDSPNNVVQLQVGLVEGSNVADTDADEGPDEAIAESIDVPRLPPRRPTLNDSGSRPPLTRETQDAIRAATEEIAVIRDILGPGSEGLVSRLTELGQLYESVSRYDYAEEAFRRAVDAAEAGQGKNHPLVADNLLHLAGALGKQNKDPEAGLLIERALSVYEERYEQDDPQWLAVLTASSRAYSASAMHSKALPLAQRALTIQEASLPIGHPQMRKTIDMLAAIHSALDEKTAFDEAVTESPAVTVPERESAAASSEPKGGIPYRILKNLFDMADKLASVNGVNFTISNRHTREGDNRPYDLELRSPRGRSKVIAQPDGTFRLPLIPTDEWDFTQLFHSLEKGALTISWQMSFSGGIDQHDQNHKLSEICQTFQAELENVDAEVWKLAGNTLPAFKNLHIAAVGVTFKRQNPVDGKALLVSGKDVVQSIDLSKSGKVTWAFDQFDPKIHSIRLEGVDHSKVSGYLWEFDYLTGDAARGYPGAITILDVESATRKVSHAAPEIESVPGALAEIVPGDPIPAPGDAIAIAATAESGLPFGELTATTGIVISPHARKEVHVGDQPRGKRVRCPYTGRVFLVP